MSTAFLFVIYVYFALKGFILFYALPYKVEHLCIYTSALVLCDVFELCVKFRVNLNAQMFV